MPSRRSSIEMNKDELQDYIRGAHTLIIVSNGKNGHPHPMPMWFYADEDNNFYCTTFEKSQKVLNWLKDPRATLLIESGKDYSELQGLMVYAQAEIVRDTDTVIDTLVNINSKNQSLSDEQRGRLRTAVANTAKKRVVLKFVPQSYVSWDHTKLQGRY